MAKPIAITATTALAASAGRTKSTTGARTSSIRGTGTTTPRMNRKPRRPSAGSGPPDRLANVKRVEAPEASEPMLVVSDVARFRMEITVLVPRRIAVFFGPNEEPLVSLVLPEEEGDALLVKLLADCPAILDLVSSGQQVEVSSGGAGGRKVSVIPPQ